MHNWHLSIDLLRQVADIVVTILRWEGIGRSCLVGSMASYLHGVSRTPNDIDILVLDTLFSGEAIKQQIVARDPRFYRVRSANPSATHTILYFYYSSTISIKVDVIPFLDQGTLDFPYLNPEDVHLANADSLPFAPLSLTLLHKLKSWEDRRIHPSPRYSQKAHTDVQDLKELLPLCLAQDIRPLEKGEFFLTDDFLADTARRIVDFVSVYPETREVWKALGFRVRRR